jgi:hypothetical protein
MNKSPAQRSDDFLKVSDQFKLGALVTETSHPVTAGLSDVARADVAAALKLLFEVDGDVLRKYREFVASGRAEEMKAGVSFLPAAVPRAGSAFSWTRSGGITGKT